jgi:hypothetical protein
MGVYRVVFEMVRECSNEKLVEYTSLVHIEIILHLVESPRRKVAWMIVRGVMAISSRKAYSIREDDARYCIGWLESPLA